MATTDMMGIQRNSEEWQQILGTQFQQLRIQAGLDQIEMANRANLSVGAIKNLEGGKGCSLKTMVQVTRVLEKTDWLQWLCPLPTISPLDMLRARGKIRERKRVYRARKPD